MQGKLQVVDGAQWHGRIRTAIPPVIRQPWVPKRSDIRERQRYPPRSPLSTPALTFLHQIIRTIDSLQLTATRSLATPANWEKGGSCMVLPSVSAEDAAEKFPEVIEDADRSAFQQAQQAPSTG